LDVLSGLVRHALFQTTTQVANDLEDDVSIECSSFDWQVSLNKVSQVRCRFGWPVNLKFEMIIPMVHGEVGHFNTPVNIMKSSPNLEASSLTSSQCPPGVTLEVSKKNNQMTA
jgi:hypothetical protein